MAVNLIRRIIDGVNGGNDLHWKRSGLDICLCRRYTPIQNDAAARALLRWVHNQRPYAVGKLLTKTVENEDLWRMAGYNWLRASSRMAVGKRTRRA